MIRAMTRYDLDAAVARLATRQHNVFSRKQVLAIGFTAPMVQRRRAAGRWTDEAPGVYGIAGGVPGWERRLMVAHLDLGPSSVVSHRSAGVLHGFAGMRPGPPELTVPPRAGRGGRWRVHQARLEAGERATVERVPTTSVERTVIDVAAVVPRDRLASVVHHLLSDRRLDLDRLAARVVIGRRAGAVALGAILDDLGPGEVPPASELEARLLAALRSGGLPDPVRQHPLPSLHEPGRVDAAYPAARLIVEADGRRWHTRVADFARDRRRDIDAGLLDWTVVRFTWDDLVHQPAWVVTVVATHLRRAA